MCDFSKKVPSHSQAFCISQYLMERILDRVEQLPLWPFFRCATDALSLGEHATVLGASNKIQSALFRSMPIPGRIGAWGATELRPLSFSKLDKYL